MADPSNLEYRQDVRFGNDPKETDPLRAGDAGEPGKAGVLVAAAMENNRGKHSTVNPTGNPALLTHWRSSHQHL